jgi:hypothetical protein
MAEKTWKMAAMIVGNKAVKIIGKLVGQKRKSGWEEHGEDGKEQLLNVNIAKSVRKERDDIRE